MENNLDSVLSEEKPEPVAEQQVETPEPETTDEGTTGEQAAPPADAKEDQIETHRKGLEAATLAERQRRQAAEQRAAAAEAKLQDFLKQQQPKNEEGPPDPAAYQDNPQEYWRLLARHEARQELKAAQEKQRAEGEAAKRREAFESVKRRVDDAIAAGQAKYRDYDAAINSGLAPFLNESLFVAIARSEQGHEVSYWLAKNPAEAARIAQLDQLDAIREVTKIEAKLTSPKPAPIPQTLTQARDARGQFQPAAFDGPTPLDAVLGRK